jgi:hypothetical protein
MMRILSILLLSLATCGCNPVLGVHVHRFHHRGVNYVACHVVVDETQPHLGLQSLDVCKDAIAAGSQHPEPLKGETR